jgi:hypothetical protein
MMIDKLMELAAYWNARFLDSDDDGDTYAVALDVCVEFASGEIEETEIYSYHGNGVFDSSKYIAHEKRSCPGYLDASSAIRCWIKPREYESNADNRDHVFQMLSNSWCASQFQDLQSAVNAFEQRLADEFGAAE